MTAIKPKVFIPFTVSNILEGLREDHKKMEWSVLGRVIKHDDKFIVADVFIPKQRNSSGYTEMEDPLCELQDYLIETGKYENAREWRLRFHSHHTMQPFRSGTDNATRKSLCTDVFFDEEMNHGWSLSIVIGAGPTYHATVDYAYKENEQMIMTHQDVEVVVGLYDDIETPEEEINSYRDTLVFENNLQINDLFPTEIADKLLTNAEFDIEAKKNKLVKQRVSAKEFDRAIEYEQSLLNNGVMIELPTLEEYIEVLKEKEKQPIPTYTPPKNYSNGLFGHIQPYGKKRKGRKKKAHNYEEPISPQDLSYYGIFYSQQRQGYIDPDTNKVVDWKTAVEVYKIMKEIDDAQDTIGHNVATITGGDLEEFGYVYRPAQRDWTIEEKPGILTVLSFADAKEHLLENNKEFFETEEVDAQEFVTSVKLEESGYSRDETTKMRYYIEGGKYTMIGDFNNAQNHYRQSQ